MGQLDKQPDNSGASDPQAAEALLRAMIQDIENLRQNLLGQLSQDVERLQREKSHLIEDIEKLQTQRQQQILQQQQLVSHIAPDLVNQLQEILISRLNQLVDSSRVSQQEASAGFGEGQSPTGVSVGSRAQPDPFSTAKRSRYPQGFPKGRESSIDSAASSGVPPTSRASDYDENLHRLIASLDSTLRATFKTLQQDLSSYQSSLSQQLGQMYSLEQQGEAILEALVSRIKAELQSESAAINSPPPTPPIAPVNPAFPTHGRNGYPQEHHYGSTVSYPSEQSAPVLGRRREPEPPAVIPQLPPRSKPAWKRSIGFLLVLLSFVTLSFENIVINVIFNKSPIFGLFKLGGFISPSVGNSLLILWLRMLVVVPLMAILVTVLYPPVWRDIKQCAQSKDWPLFLNVVGSGFFLFLSQVLLYLALGPISPGVAITIYFIYPIFTVLLAWVLYGVRPSLVSNLVIFSVLVGFVLISLPGSRTTELSSLGVSAAAGAGISFAFHVILARTPATKLNPVPLLWINYVIILVFSSLCLAGPVPDSWRLDVVSTLWPELIISSLVLGGTTVLSNLLNNMGLRRIDTRRASILILRAIVPALTALLAWAIIQSTLQVQQIFGLVIITLGVAALSLEQWLRQTKATQPAGRKLK